MVTNKFDQFMQHRQGLIDQYVKGDLTKDEFIEENFRFINALGIKPFQKIDSVKKALYNYQYYNALAKYYQKRAHELNSRHEARTDFLELSNYYYDRKDRVTERLLKFLDFTGIEAYYVQVKSPNLRKKLFEIRIKEYDSIILHSKNEAILTMLKNENAFRNEIRKSLVDSYINQKY